MLNGIIPVITIIWEITVFIRRGILWDTIKGWKFSFKVTHEEL